MFEFPAGFYCDVRIEDTYVSLFRRDMEKLEEAKEKIEAGVFIRLYNGVNWLYSATTSIDQIQAAIYSLAKAEKPNPNIDNDPIVKKLEAHTGTFYSFKDAEVRQTSRSSHKS